MIHKNDKVVILSNKYRKQYIKPYKKQLNIQKFSLKSLFTVDKFIINDFPSFFLLKFLKIFKKKIYVFLWNNIDELLEKIESEKNLIDIYNKYNIYFLFPFPIDEILLSEIKSKNLNFNYQILEPKIQIKKDNLSLKKTQIIFYGELNISSENFDKNIYSKLNEISLNILDGKIYYYQIEKQIIENLGYENYYNNVLKTRNLVRFHYLTKLSLNFKKKLVLIGDNLKIISNATHLKSNYKFSYRMSLYKNFQNAIFLDLLCKSTYSALYPRSQELLFYTNDIFQLKTLDNFKLTKHKKDMIIFDSQNDLLNKLNKIIK